MGLSSDNLKGLFLAISSSFFVGSSFIVKKKGLKKAEAKGRRAGSGGHSYLYEPLWWAGLLTSFIVYTCIVLIMVLILIFLFVPKYGQKYMAVYIAICSLMGSLTVMSMKALGIALKLTISGSNQLKYFQTWFFTVVVVVCCVMQLNYLNKALDTFNTFVISPVYYVTFTSFTIIASMIMFKDQDSQNASQIATELCGFLTILSGTFLLHKTMDIGDAMALKLSIFASPNTEPNICKSPKNEPPNFSSPDNGPPNLNKSENEPYIFTNSKSTSR